MSERPADGAASGLPIAEATTLDVVDFDKGDGLVPLIAQHAGTGEVLMLGYASREALERTLEDDEVWFFSRSRRRLWRKGETSGNVLRLRALHADCDRDALVALVEPAGPTCHLGARSCFGARPTLLELADVIAERATAASGSGQERPTSYTVRLLGDANLRLKKLAEEAAELALACVSGDTERVAEEAADVVYHTLVAARAAGVGLDDVLGVLAQRRRAS